MTSEHEFVGVLEKFVEERGPVEVLIALSLVIDRWAYRDRSANTVNEGRSFAARLSDFINQIEDGENA